MPFRRIGASSTTKKIETDFSEETDFFATAIQEGSSRKTSRGTRWTALRGIWSKNPVTSKITSETSSESFPINYVDALSPDVSITLNDIGNGAGASIWITDAGNWWGVGSYQQPEDCNCSEFTFSCSCGTYFFSCNCATEYSLCNCTYFTRPCNCRTRTTTTCAATGCTSFGCKGFGVTGYYFCGTADRPRWCPNYGCTGGFGCTGFGCTRFTTTSREVCDTCPAQDCNICESYVCQTCSGYSCNTCIGTTCNTCYPQYVRLLQSASNTVATLATWAFSAIIKALKIKTSGDRISLEAFSDSSGETKIDTTRVYDAPSDTDKSTKFGLLISPSSYSETKSAKSIKIERNKE